MGPYQVGYKEFYCSNGNIVSAFYPITNEEYIKDEKACKNVPWLLFGEKSMLGFQRSSTKYGSGKTAYRFGFKPYDHLKLNATKDSNIVK